jgi:hypothetical protein
MATSRIRRIPYPKLREIVVLVARRLPALAVPHRNNQGRLALAKAAAADGYEGGA